MYLISASALGLGAGKAVQLPEGILGLQAYVGKLIKVEDSISTRRKGS